MSIECIAIFPRGEQKPGLHRNLSVLLPRVESGNAIRYKLNEHNIGLVVLAGCFDEDNGGIIYITKDEVLERARDEEGGYTSEALEGVTALTLPFGGILSIPFHDGDRVDHTLLFMHQSPN